MNELSQLVFLSEVERQCKLALIAYEDLKQALIDRLQPNPIEPIVNWEDPAQEELSTAKYEQWLSAIKCCEEMRRTAHDRIWYSVQAFLVAAGNISKLFWPSSKGNLMPERGPELKMSLTVEEDSPLASRKLRNHFEHFDERLEQWAVSQKSRAYIDSNIGPADWLRGLVPEAYFRNFDTTNFVVTFRGDNYPLRPIMEAIQAIHQRAIVKLS